jgi:hypothetical protein
MRNDSDFLRGFLSIFRASRAASRLQAKASDIDALLRVADHKVIDSPCTEGG